ncbi:MAG: Lrp/AsnC family transcriptional regulator [Gammaproteobacteria bacterium]|nr:Lrp/AsnC family transcriptional regulator [Gammaproteobacteria bacterium]
MKLDTTDRKILELLQEDGSISNLDLAEKVNLSATPCLRRVKQLASSGIIERTAALLNPAKLNLKLTAIVAVTMDRHTPDRFQVFEEKVKMYPEVIECSIVTGQSADYLLKVVIPDIDHYQEFLLGRLTRIEGVVGVHSSFVLRKIINKTALPLNYTD